MSDVKFSECFKLRGLRNCVGLDGNIWMQSCLTPFFTTTTDISFKIVGSFVDEVVSLPSCNNFKSLVHKFSSVFFSHLF